MSTLQPRLRPAGLAAICLVAGQVSFAAPQSGTTYGSDRPAPPAQTATETLSPSDIAERYSDSIVQVLAEVGDAVLRQGTGFPLTSDGAFATSLHLLDGATRVWVRSASGEKFQLEVIQAYDTANDLVVLSVAPFDLAVPPLGESGALEIGDPVVVIGNPLGLTRSVTDGILSARRLPEESSASAEDARFASALLVAPECELLQISAPVAPGTSGAPVFDLAGRVVGIEMGGMSEGALDLNFAIPVEALEALTDRFDGLDLESLQWQIDEERREIAEEFLENARLAIESDDLRTAEAELQKALARFPRYEDALLTLSELLLAQGASEQAEEVLLEATRDSPYSVGLWQALGEFYLETAERETDLNRAGSCFQQVLDLEPGHSGATFGMGVVYLEQSRLDDAIENLEIAVRDDSQLSRAGFALARAYIERYRFEEAAEILDDVLWEDPDFAPAHYGRALVAYFLDDEWAEESHWRRFFDLVEDDPQYAVLYEDALSFLRTQRPSLLPQRYQ